MVEENENTVEGVLKSTFEDFRVKIEQLALEKEAALEELFEKYASAEVQIKAKIDTKYNEVITKSESLPAAIREASLKKLRAGREAEIKRELDSLKNRRKTEKEQLAAQFKDGVGALFTPEKASEVATRVKDLIRTSSTCTPLISPTDRIVPLTGTNKILRHTAKTGLFPLSIKCIPSFLRLLQPQNNNKIAASNAAATKGRKHFIFPPPVPESQQQPQIVPASVEEESKQGLEAEQASSPVISPTSRAEPQKRLSQPVKSATDILEGLHLNSYAAQFIANLKKKVHEKKVDTDN